MPKIIPAFEIWFNVPDDPENGRVCIRHLLGGEVSDITNQATDLRTIYHQGALKRESRHDLAKDVNLTICAAITNWENFKNEKGKELPCTARTILLYSKQKWFTPWIAEKRKIVAKEFAEKHQDKLKNSEALPPGSPASDDKAVTPAN